MAMRCLRFAWPEHVKFVTVHLGHIGGNSEKVMLNLLYPTYSRTARKIIQTLSRPKIPNEITYPFVYRIMYAYALKLVPDSLYFKLLRTLYIRKICS